MEFRVLSIGIVIFLVFGKLTIAECAVAADICPVVSLADSLLLDSRDLCWNYISIFRGGDFFSGVTEGDDVSLQGVLNLVHKSSHEYVSVLFYASWCPFSRACRPTFAMISSLYPSIRHFAIEESSVKPSILSRYGVHGFPTLFLLNSTMRMRYQGSRSLGSLVTFYSDVTGLKPLSLDHLSLETMGNSSNLAKLGDVEEENCPFSWARSPEKMLRQETYLALASTFVLLRLIYVFLPVLLACARCACRRQFWNSSLMSLWDHPLAHLRRAMQVFNALKEGCKRSNLQEGAMNARAWASKSLASVSIGDASSSRECVGS